MANTTDDIRQEISKDRQDIADTRAAITEKLALLGGHVQESVDTVKHAFDLHYQVQQRPWLMLGGSLLVGYVLGRRGGPPSTIAHTSPEPSAQAQVQPGVVTQVRNQVKGGFATLKGAAVGAVLNTLWAMAAQVLVPRGRPIDGAFPTPGPGSADRTPRLSNGVITAPTNGRRAA